MTTPKLTITKIEDHEGNGHCTACGRENLRWICTLSDSTKVGTECAKKVLGWKPQPPCPLAGDGSCVAGPEAPTVRPAWLGLGATGRKHYNWIPDFVIVAEHNERGTHFVKWQHKTTRETRETRDGGLTAVGGVRRDWQDRGWAA